MDAALSNPVASSLSVPGGDAAAQHIHLSLEDMLSVLRHWESLDAVPWDDETRLACSAFIETASLTLSEWKALLVQVPEQVEERYRRVMKLLLKKRLIDQFAFDEEMKAMATLSPATMARRGKEFADWYRNTD